MRMKMLLTTAATAAIALGAGATSASAGFAPLPVKAETTKTHGKMTKDGYEKCRAFTLAWAERQGLEWPETHEEVFEMCGFRPL